MIPFDARTSVNQIPEEPSLTLHKFPIKKFLVSISCLNSLAISIFEILETLYKTLPKPIMFMASKTYNFGYLFSYPLLCKRIHDWKTPTEFGEYYWQIQNWLAISELIFWTFLDILMIPKATKSLNLLKLGNWVENLEFPIMGTVTLAYASCLWGNVLSIKKIENEIECMTKLKKYWIDLIAENSKVKLGKVELLQIKIENQHNLSIEEKNKKNKMLTSLKKIRDSLNKRLTLQEKSICLEYAKEWKREINFQNIQMRNTKVCIVRDLISLLAIATFSILPASAPKYLQVIPQVMQTVAFSLSLKLSIV